jgi:hypothetical protein
MGFAVWGCCFLQSLLELCSGEAIAAKAAVDLCITQIKKDLSSDQLPLAAFHESAERAFHATSVFVKVGGSGYQHVL